MMKRKGERMQPCRTPKTMSKYSVCPLQVLTQQLELLYKTHQGGPFLKPTFNIPKSPQVWVFFKNPGFFNPEQHATKMLCCRIQDTNTTDSHQQYKGIKHNSHTARQKTTNLQFARFWSQSVLKYTSIINIYILKYTLCLEKRPTVFHE